MAHRSYKFKDMTDFEVLDWFCEQEIYFREPVLEMSKARTLQGLVDYLRKNIDKLKQLETKLKQK